MKRCSAPRLHVRGRALHERDRLALDGQRRVPIEDEIHLVPLVGLLPVGLGGDEDLDAEIESR